MAQDNMYFSLYSLHQILKSSSFSAIDLGKQNKNHQKQTFSSPKRQQPSPNPNTR